MSPQETPTGVEQVLDTPQLAAALERDWFKSFLDQISVAIAISELEPPEKVVFVNAEFERLTGQGPDLLVGGSWDRMRGEAAAANAAPLAEAVVDEKDYVGVFTLSGDGQALAVDAWSNVIEDERGAPVFRLVALVENNTLSASALDELHDRVREKDTQLLELQHRVKNNLQMITALIRVEARSVTDRSTGEGFDRLAGRVEALGLLYRALAAETASGDAVDLGVYLSEVASAVMRAHAVEGIRLDLKVDTWPVSIDVAMPAGLVANELLTNSLKHAFAGREGGTITLHSTAEPRGCRVVIADDGVGLPEGATWPKPGKLSALILRSLQQNARARIDIQSAPGQGMRVTINFTCDDAAPAS